VKILKVNKRYAYGKIEKIINPSKDRVEPDCPVFAQCGGCSYRHINYEKEKIIKYNKVRDNILRIGKIDTKICNIVGAEEIIAYRNKCQIPLGNDAKGRVVSGFFGVHSHRIVENNGCKLQQEEFQGIIDITKKFLEYTKEKPYDESTGTGKLRHIYLRKAVSTGEIMVCFVVNGNGLKQEKLLIDSIIQKYPNVKSVVFNSNNEKTNVILGDKNRVAYGNPYIVDKLCNKEFIINPKSFYQVNHHMAEKLYYKAQEYADLQKDDVLLDLYCGTGTIGLTMADKCKKLYGIEIVPEAIENAKKNAEINKINNAEFICADATRKRDKLLEIAPDVIVVDPPRKGLTKELIETIIDVSPKRIVYVSCDSGTLARDLQLFKESYKVEEITPFDLFPRTPHVECVVLMTKKSTS
ncbi:MAG: 23S rRNA (uracil(1939)-C(5))-methyltransferase RlmD, partial [Acutalibacteraceae bacterium]